MPDARKLRELLIADLAVARGIASPSAAALAIQHFWLQGELGVADELVRVARLRADALDKVKEEADRLIAMAGGDAHSALERHGGLDHSIHAALTEGAAPVSQAISSLEVPMRVSLRHLPSERYIGFELVGKGGMGMVFRAEDRELRRPVALKMVRPSAVTGMTDDGAMPAQLRPPDADTPGAKTFEQLSARFLQEVYVTSGLDHPGIVPVHEVGQTRRGIPYYTMRLVRGGRTLERAIDEVADAPFEDRLRLLEPFVKLCDTVSFAHSKGVVHRDLKPENVALGQYGEVLLLDWGLAKVEGDEDSRWQDLVRELRETTDLQTLRGQGLGTLGYTAPEAAIGDLKSVGRRSDIYSLGAILFRALTGRLPHEFQAPAEFLAKLRGEDAPRAEDIDPRIPSALGDVCAEALQRAPEDRPGDAGELADAVRGWQAASAIAREVEGHLRDARSALDAAASVQAVDRLMLVERAVGALDQAQAKHPVHVDNDQLRRHADALRESGIRERGRQAGRTLVRRTAIGVLLAVSITAVIVVALINQGRRREEDAREVAEQARAAMGIALMAESQAKRDAEADRRTADHLRGRAEAAEAIAQEEATRAKEEARRAGRAETRATALAGDLFVSLRTSSSRAIAAEAERVGSTDPGLAARLALEALRRAETPEAVSALRRQLSVPYVSATRPRPSQSTPTLYQRSCVVSDDGQVVLAADHTTGDMELWTPAGPDAEFPFQVRTVAGEAMPDPDPAISPTSEHGVAEDPPVTLGTPVLPYIGMDGQRFAIATASDTLTVFDNRGIAVAAISCDLEALVACALHAGGTTAVAEGVTVRAWGDGDSSSTPRVRLDLPHRPLELAWGVSGKILLALLQDGSVYRIDMATRTSRRIRDHLDPTRQDMSTDEFDIPGPRLRVLSRDRVSVRSARGPWRQDLLAMDGQLVAEMPGKAIGYRADTREVVTVHVNDGIYLVDAMSGATRKKYGHIRSHCHEAIYLARADGVLLQECPSGETYAVSLRGERAFYLGSWPDDAGVGPLPLLLDGAEHGLILMDGEARAVDLVAGEFLAHGGVSVVEGRTGSYAFRTEARECVLSDGGGPTKVEIPGQVPEEARLVGLLSDSTLVFESRIAEEAPTVHFVSTDGALAYEIQSAYEYMVGRDSVTCVSNGLSDDGTQLVSTLVKTDGRERSESVTEGVAGVFNNSVLVVGRDGEIEVRTAGGVPKSFGRPPESLNLYSDKYPAMLEMGTVVSPDGEAILGASGGERWLWIRSEELVRLPQRISGITRSSVSRGGRTVLLSRFKDGRTQVYGSSGERTATIDGLPHEFVVLSPKGNLILMYGRSGRSALHRGASPSEVRVLTARGDEVCRLEIPGASVSHARFSRSGEHIITTSTDNIVRFWHANWMKARRAAVSRFGDVLSQEERGRFSSLLDMPGAANDAR